MFQFQHGAIGSKILKKQPYPVSRFQFQHGAIGSNNFKGLDKLIDVSIPAWCDWETSIKSQLTSISPGFNSSMVRLGEYLQCVQSVRAVVSIPAWCDWEC